MTEGTNRLFIHTLVTREKCNTTDATTTLFFPLRSLS
ncbi:hypothetical protein LINPERHAP2_LOCUS20714 [Linum perenne]